MQVVWPKISVPLSAYRGIKILILHVLPHYVQYVSKVATACSHYPSTGSTMFPQISHRWNSVLEKNNQFSHKISTLREHIRLWYVYLLLMEGTCTTSVTSTWSHTHSPTSKLISFPPELPQINPGFIWTSVGDYIIIYYCVFSGASLISWWTAAQHVCSFQCKTGSTSRGTENSPGCSGPSWLKV